MSATRLAAALLGLVAIAAAAMAASYGLWQYDGPKAGLFPFVAAILLIGTSVRTAVSSTGTKVDDPVDAGRFLRYGTVIALYPLLIAIFGTMAATGCVFLAILRGIERQSWPVATSCSLAAMAGAIALFGYLLDVPLPRGILE